MNNSFLKLYHSLPYPLRCLVASARGYQLRWWRYGPETDRLVEEALEREFWSTAKWKAWQEERLQFILHRTVTKVPYYREYWARQTAEGKRQNAWKDLGNWPVLKKEALRANPSAFLADDCEPRRMWREHTSGTTYKPLTLWFSRACVHAWFALCEARLRRWHGVTRHDRWGMIGGQIVSPADAQNPPFWVWNAAMRQLYLSSYHLNAQNAPAYVRAIRRYGPNHLICYSSAATSLAHAVESNGLEIHGIRVVVTNAEPVFSWQRDVVQRVFRSPVRESYGMVELVAAASECPQGARHLWPEAGLVEVLADEADKPVQNGKVGRLICTGLLNTDMPLIRYEVGDRGATDNNGTDRCGCGRTLPLLHRLEGRINDLIVTKDDRRVYLPTAVFHELPVIEAQVVQEAPDYIQVKVVVAEGYSTSTAQHIRERLKARLGGLYVEVETVAEIPRGPNGKFRAVVSKVGRVGCAQAKQVEDGVIMHD
ncbi:MAG: phenylacetate--CoA ligase family protein [Verrucomicrobia bacterium]|nr:phenylacetate--CoA ligase family protein [Verrucomicrobiota bacterium]